MKPYDRSYVTIDLNALFDNIAAMKKAVGAKTAMCAVIKTDAYGHGATVIAQKIKDKVWGFAVATADEAHRLRQQGIENPILILGYVPKDQMAGCIREEIRFTLYSREVAEEICDVVREMKAAGEDKQAIVHVKVDTGMGRLGFICTGEHHRHDSIEEIAKICQHKELFPEGIFMHFARADEADKMFSYRQHDRFELVRKELAEKGITFPLVHCDNSAGIIDFPNWHHEMVRMGIALYGLYPSDGVSAMAVPLKPVLSWYAHVAFVKDIPKGTSISYGGTFVSTKPMRVATVTVGYGDGYPRLLSSEGYMLIHGKKARILGRVCMDQVVVDVTDIPETKMGDTVVLVGQSGGAKIVVEDLSMLCGRFNYELLCDINARIPRIYVQDGKVVARELYGVVSTLDRE